jgi:uncharacterized protein HemX
MNAMTNTEDAAKKSEAADFAAGVSPDAESPASEAFEPSSGRIAGDSDLPKISEAVAESPRNPSAPPKRVSGVSAFWVFFWALPALAALGLSGWQWRETRRNFAETYLEFEKFEIRLSEIEAAAAKTSTSSIQPREEPTVLRDRLGAFETRISGVESKISTYENALAEAKARQVPPETLPRKPSSSRDASLVLEAERSVAFAAQSLQLAGDARGAILALQSADSRLSEDAQFIGLRKAIARDLARLRALPRIDRAGMSIRLENVISMLDTLPLAIDARPGEDASPAVPPVNAEASLISAEYWKQAGSRAWKKIRGHIRVQRIDRQEAVLLAPEQTFFLRENCRLRLLSARATLLSADQRLFRIDVEQARKWIEAYFDTNKAQVKAVLETLNELSKTEISVELPSLDESFSALKAYRAAKAAEAAEANGGKSE